MGNFLIRLNIVGYSILNIGLIVFLIAYPLVDDYNLFERVERAFEAVIVDIIINTLYVLVSCSISYLIGAGFKFHMKEKCDG